jgi:hypothetical protein
MIDDVADLARLGEFTGEDFELFTRCVRELLAHCFILRGVEDVQYTFAIRNYAVFEAYFAGMGAQLRKDESLGVVAWRGGHESRSRLGKEDTCALLVFRLFFEEKRAAIRLSDFPTITVFDFLGRYTAITEGDLRKTKLVDLLRRFNALKLVKAPADADPEGLILLYPSLALVLDQEGIEEVRGFLKGKTE